MRRFDTAAMFGSLWLFASLLIDAITPKELNVYVIGVAIAPATVVSAILYWLRVPTIDFAVSFATLWMMSAMILELVTPEPLSPIMVVVALAPMVTVGIVINLLYWLRPVPVTSAES